MRRVTLYAAAFFLLAGFTMAWAAQDKAKSDKTTTQLSPIEVLGASKSVQDVNASGSVVVIPHREIIERGVTSLAELLKLPTMMGAAQNTHFNTRGTGRSFADIHNLGAERVLVLVNGQRWIPTLAGPVDLSTIPLSIVKRVEILIDGASTIYGADAIAGVVNIITTKNLAGANVGVYYGGYDARNDGGGFDGKTEEAYALIGNTDDRGSVMTGFGYRKAEPVWASNRTISREPLAGFGNRLGSTATPAGHLQLLTDDPGSYAGLCDSGNGGFAYDCNLAGPFTDADAQRFTDSDRYNDAAASYIETPQERWYLFSQGNYSISDNLLFDYLVGYVRRNASELTAPGAWPLGAQGNARADGLPIGISATALGNPFGDDLVPVDPSSSTFDAWCARYGAGPSGQCSSNYDVLQFFGARPLGQGPQTITQNANNFYFNGGLSGYFPLFRNEWRYQLRYGYGQTLETEIRNGFTDTNLLQRALGPASQCTGACVPLDLFAGSSGVTPAMLAYTNTNLHFTSDIVMRNYTAGLAGDFFDSWYAGSWNGAFGYEYLESDGSFQPDALVSGGDIIGFAIQPSSGRQATNAQYAQIKVPLASGLSAAKQLSLELGDRFSQLRWAGGQDASGAPLAGRAHNSSGRFALHWQPNDDLSLRATWAQGFRVPTVAELFGAQSENALPLVDPCVANQSLPPGEQRNLPACPQNGHGGAVQPQPTVPVTTGGNPALRPEQGLTRTLSLTWSPSLVPRLHFSADFYKIEVNAAVGQLDPQALLDGCYLGSATSYCTQISRENGAITNVMDTNLNTGSLHSNGFDVSVAYGFHLGRAGTLWLSGLATFTRFLVQCNVVQGTSGPVSRCANSAGSVAANGEFGVPKRRINLSADWRVGPLAVVWKAYIIGRMDERCSASRAAALSPPPWSWCSNNAGDTNELGTTVYNDIETSYTVEAWDTTFTLGVNNFLDRSPPIAMTAYTGSFLPVYYRIPGRFVYARASINF